MILSSISTVYWRAAWLKTYQFYPYSNITWAAHEVKLKCVNLKTNIFALLRCLPALQRQTIHTSVISLFAYVIVTIRGVNIWTALHSILTRNLAASLTRHRNPTITYELHDHLVRRSIVTAVAGEVGILRLRIGPIRINRRVYTRFSRLVLLFSLPPSPPPPLPHAAIELLALLNQISYRPYLWALHSYMILVVLQKKPSRAQDR